VSRPKAAPSRDENNERRKTPFPELERWVYWEQDTPFRLTDVYETEDGTAIIQLKNLQRALGMLRGQLKEYDPETAQATLVCGGHEVSCSCYFLRRRTKSFLQRALSQEMNFTIWPTVMRALPVNKFEDDNLVQLRRVHVVSPRSDQGFDNNYIEVIGKLSRFWKSGFEVQILSQIKEKQLFVYFHGEYPFPDEKGEWIWVRGRFDPEQAILQYEEAEALATVSREEREEILKKARRRGEQRPESE
jgi:hypothetical protein